MQALRKPYLNKSALLKRVLEQEQAAMKLNRIDLVLLFWNAAIRLGLFED